jgi:cell pole-organizing protein PopZ
MPPTNRDANHFVPRDCRADVPPAAITLSFEEIMSAGSNHPPQPDGADPSMEEILASIRKILNEDDASAAESDPPHPQADADDVLILDESMIVQQGIVNTAVRAGAEPDMSGNAPEGSAPGSAGSVLGSGTPERSDEPTGRDAAELVAPEAAAAAASSLGSLVRTLAAGRTTPVYSGGPTLEDLVRAELRPMVKAWMDTHLKAAVEVQIRSELRPLLKAWLDGNLPSMVERLVCAEIEKVVGRAVP